MPERHAKKALKQHIFLQNDKGDKRTPKILTHELIEQHELKIGELRNYRSRERIRNKQLQK